MNNIKQSTSRRKTPWTMEENNEDFTEEDLTLLEKLIDEKNKSIYEFRHPKLLGSSEIEFLNSMIPTKCPYCNSSKFKKSGFNKNRVQRYHCNNTDDCGKSFLITSNTIFDNHKISLIEWIEFCLEVFNFQSFNSISKSTRTSYATTLYWIHKVFYLLKDYQDDILLKDNVSIDETFYRVSTSNLVKYNGYKPTDVSKNKYCIGIGCDKDLVFCKIENNKSATTSDDTFKTFCNHIKRGSTLTHDGEKRHNKLVEDLELQSFVYLVNYSRNVKKEDDPLYRINELCSFLKAFFQTHKGFDRKYLQDYLNLFSFIFNPPDNPFEKVEYLIEKAFKTPGIIKYREELLQKHSNY
jgi:transposase-like protein